MIQVLARVADFQKVEQSHLYSVAAALEEGALLDCLLIHLHRRKLGIVGSLFSIGRARKFNLVDFRKRVDKYFIIVKSPSRKS